jgi:ubiquinone/menaquinone biosynthesis C-methylase UbiE
MTWEEVILWARSRPEFDTLLHDAYLAEDLSGNAKRYHESEEFNEVLHLLHRYIPQAQVVADIGAGNGVASYALAKSGYRVSAVEPDLGMHTGRGAIEQLKKQEGLQIDILEGFGESIPLEDQSMDVVFVRQALHHAAELSGFLKECYRVLKPGGLFFSLRDHVIDHPEGLVEFLSQHPMHQYYGGEHAFTEQAYKHAIKEAGLQIERIFQHYDSVINYAPENSRWLQEHQILSDDARLSQKLGLPASFSAALKMYRGYLQIRYGYRPPVSVAQGRHIAFIARR